ncbi:hypothetical protein ACOMCU_00440 [Lysinibacillus sp. UGB7]|uniref:hypothetical protein n=1 Tax=Lysinibacillus sp. UGB7 TaxID=3411039 RepID=UPI003B793665
MNIKEELAQMELGELLDCVAELERFELDGVLINGKIRALNRKHFENNPTMLMVVDKFVYRELAKRHTDIIKVLRNIDNHIRSTPEPVPYIVEELKAVLPEYKN